MSLVEEAGRVSESFKVDHLLAIPDLCYHKHQCF